MEITKTSVLRFGTLLLQAAALLRLLCLLSSFLWSHKWSIPSAFGSCSKYCRQIQSWLKRQQGHGDSSSEQELGVMRCKWMWRFAFIGCVLSMYRMISRQAMRHDVTTGFDLNILVAATCSLLVVSFPGLLNPRSQDIVYVVMMFFLDASYLIPPVEVDVRDVIAFSFPGRFIYGALARRTSATAFCMLLHLLQALQIARLQGLQEDSAGTDHSHQTLFILFWMFLGILTVRQLIHENALLKVNLQKRSVELGAVSSLLTPCYDAVVELDQGLKLTQDSGQLSSMLLQTAPKVGGLAGKSLLDFFSEGDRKRISEQVLNPVESVSVLALNADMLDSDFNHVKVELFCTRFKNFASERCFLVGLRELQDLEPHVRGTRVSRGPSNGSLGNEALIVVFDLHSFDIHTMNGEMQRLCRPYLGDTTPDNILDIASQDTRLSLCRQLQQLGNAIAQEPHEVIREATVTFDLPGVSQARSQRSEASGAISEMYQLHEVSQRDCGWLRVTLEHRQYQVGSTNFCLKYLRDFAGISIVAVQSTGATPNFGLVEAMSRKVIYGARIPFFIREHYRPPPAPTHMRGIFAKWVSIPGGIPGGSLLQLPSAIVDVAMTAGGEAESLSIYSCLAGLKVLKIATRSRDAPDTVVEQLVQRALSRGVDLEHESMTRVRHSDCPAWVPSTVGVESMMV
ncbi:unnamed protein product [Cladocopium goreaui]|uniref:PAS domain-containing protein n=1 Tax=Cladocopium goreaui TaxID=2562237 RepID=A0A9P1FIE4_9DINO|nr:unnamed protein product [Cladocopium goreaui]